MLINIVQFKPKPGYGIRKSAYCFGVKNKESLTDAWNNPLYECVGSIPYKNGGWFAGPDQLTTFKLRLYAS